VSNTLMKRICRRFMLADFEVVKLAAAFGMDGPELLRRAVAKAQRHTQSLPTLLRKSG
jgi:hypothetical protein